MDNLEQIQEIWQSHQPELVSTIDTNKIGDSILSKIKRTEQNIFRKNILKTIAIGIIISWFLWTLSSLGDVSLLIWISVGLISISTLVTMVIYWRIQFKSSNLNHNLPQNEFIDDTIAQMKKHKKQFLLLFKCLIAILIVGINLFYFDLLKDQSLNLRLIFHFGMSTFFLIIGFAGLKFRERKFRNEFQSIIDELESIKE